MGPTKKRPLAMVAGGAGYVGSHVVLELLKADFGVVVVDRCSPDEKPESVQRVEQITGRRVAFHSCNIQDEEDIRKVFEGERVDCVIHVATIKNASDKPLHFYQIDLGGSLILFQAMREFGVKRLVFASTAKLYGETPRFLPITEAHPIGRDMNNALVKSKFIIEEALRDLCVSDAAWSVICLRYFDPVGAHESGLIGESNPSNQVATIARDAVLSGKTICLCRKDYESLYEYGTRDYVHVSDIAAGYVAAVKKSLEPEGPRGFRAYNLGSGRGFPIVEVIEKLSVLSGKPLVYQIEEEGTPEQPIYVSGELAEQELGWKPTKDMEDICRDTLQWVAKSYVPEASEVLSNV